MQSSQLDTKKIVSASHHDLSGISTAGYFYLLTLIKTSIFPEMNPVLGSLILEYYLDEDEKHDIYSKDWLLINLPVPPCTVIQKLNNKALEISQKDQILFDMHSLLTLKLNHYFPIAIANLIKEYTFDLEKQSRAIDILLKYRAFYCALVTIPIHNTIIIDTESLFMILESFAENKSFFTKKDLNQFLSESKRGTKVLEPGLFNTFPNRTITDIMKNDFPKLIESLRQINHLKGLQESMSGFLIDVAELIDRPELAPRIYKKLSWNDVFNFNQGYMLFKSIEEYNDYILQQRGPFGIASLDFNVNPNHLISTVYLSTEMVSAMDSEIERKKLGYHLKGLKGTAKIARVFKLLGVENAEINSLADDILVTMNSKNWDFILKIYEMHEAVKIVDDFIARLQYSFLSFFKKNIYQNTIDEASHLISLIQKTSLQDDVQIKYLQRKISHLKIPIGLQFSMPKMLKELNNTIEELAEKFGKSNCYKILNR